MERHFTSIEFQGMEYLRYTLHLLPFVSVMSEAPDVEVLTTTVIMVHRLCNYKVGCCWSLSFVRVIGVNHLLL